MKVDIGAVFEQLVSMYAKLPLAQKIAIPVLIMASMFSIVFVSSWANKPDYQVLFANLEEADAGAVVESLKDKKVKFRLRDGGKTIDINPPELVHELRIELAAGGLPRGSNVGYEVFNETSLGQTGFVEKINFVRAIQGELERTIASIDSIKHARVHITIPKPSVFVKRDAFPTASVLLKLRPGTDLAPSQVKGIAHLVAGSVERLKSENVTIMDSRGKLLNEKLDEEMTGGADVTRLAYKQKVEKAYMEGIESMLTAVLGPGKAVARITADIDFNKYEKEEEAYDPAGQVIRSERSIEESAGLTAEGGVPGVVSNLTNDPGLLTPPDSSKNSNLRSESVKNFEVSRSVSRTIAASGALERLTVAVMVDGQHISIPTGKKDESGDPITEKHYKPLTAEMLRKIENLVKQTVGFDATRGDVVTVENMKFFESDEDLEGLFEAQETQVLVFKLLPYVGSGLLLIILFILVKPLVTFLVKPTEAEVDLSRLLPTGIQELEAELEAERGKLSSLPTVEVPEIDIEEVEGILSENSRLVRENPQQAALLIRYWLNETGL